MKINFIILFLMLFLIIGCASTKPQTLTQSGQQIAKDPVCEYFADMGCIDVTVMEDTPRSTHEGEIYYFCSQRCKIDFDKKPSKYLTKR
ncbi:MAG: YHS domain-containing protein [Planctomycetota bacterium]|jgi:YHS domain-containing protein